MWFGNKWCLIQEEIIDQVSCKEHRHERLEILQHGIWTFPSADYYEVEVAVRLEVLRPFLFENSYQHSIFTKWILEMGLLPRGNFIENDEYNTETLEYIRIFDAIAVQVTRILNTIEITSEESGCSALKTLLIKHRGKSEILLKFANFQDALNYLRKDPLFRILMKNADISPVLKENVWASAYIISYCAYFNRDTLSKPREISRSLLYLNDTGNDYFKDEAFDAAISTYSEIIRQNRYSDIVYSNRAETYLRTEKWVKAEMDARRALTLNPTRCEFYRKLALALEGQGKVHSAHVRAQEGQMLCVDPKRCPIYPKLHSVFQSLNSRCLAAADCSETKGVEISITPKSGDLPLPELLDDSEEDEEPLCTNVEEVPRRAKVDKRCERKTSEEGTREKNGCQNSSFTIGELIQMFKKKTERGSRFILAKNEPRAIEEFEEALEIASSLEELGHLVDERELMPLKYALGMSLSAAGDFDNLQKALTYFEDLKKRHDCSEFPALFYGLGFVLVKLFRFEEAMVPLMQSTDLVKESKVLKRYNWPGTDTVIDETIKEKLQEKVSELINECRYAPKPDAVCRSTECPFTRNIYYRDPNIKGCYRLFCVENCRIEFHSQCWKSVRDENEKTEKDFLDSLCLTPDCGNVVYLIQIISQDGEIQKTFESTINRKRKVTKHRKSKLERKTETRDLKKRKKLEKVKKPFNERERDEDNDERDDSLIKPNDVEFHEIGDPNPVEDSAMENLPVNNNPIIYDVNSEPHYVFKKEESVESDNARIKPSKTRESKSKPKKNVIGIDEFCKDAILDSASNPYLERVQRLQINKEWMEEIDIISEHQGMTAFNSVRAKDRSVPSSFDEGTEEMSNPISLKTIEREEKPSPRKKAEEPILKLSDDVTEQSRDQELTDISKERASDVVGDEQAFQLQVTLLALPEELRMNLIAGIINNFPNKRNFLENLSKMEGQNGEIDGPNEMASHIDGQIASEEVEKLKETNNKLENALVNLRDINVRLNKTHSVVKNTLEQEIRDTREKLRSREIEFKNSRVSHEMELKRSSQEKQKILEEMKVIKKENENYVNLKRMADELFKRLEESQSEIASLKNLSESLTFTNSNLYVQLDNCQIKMKKALECLIEERRQLGSLLMKIEIEKTRMSLQQTGHELASTYPNSVELARLENSREIRKKRLDNLLKAQEDFLEKMNECSRSLKANEDDFQINNIPPLPVAYSLSEAKAPLFIYPNAGGQLGYLTNPRPPLLPNPPLANFYYVPPTLDGTISRTLSQPPGITPSPTYDLKVSPISSRPSSTNSYDRPTSIEMPSANPQREVTEADFKTRAKSSYEKIVQIIKRKLPYLSEVEINFYIKQYRGLGMRFGGKRNEEIANTMVNYILDQRASNQKLLDEKKPKGLAGVSEIYDAELISSKKWKVNDSGMGGNFSSNDCSICMEPLSEATKFQAECGHSCFHEKCVRPWLIEKSSCPICRKYLLLPDEFPKL